MATVGNTTKPTSAMAMTGLNNQNQVALKITMPSDGEITHVGVWCAGNGSAATMKVCVWGSTGNLRRASDSFNAPGQSLAQGNSAKEEHALTSPLAVSDGDVLYIGFSSDPTEARQWGVNGSGTHWRDTSTSQGADANFVSSSGSIGAYAIYTTNKPPNKPAIQSPKNNVILPGTDMSPVLNATFSDPDGGNIQNYDLQVDNGSGFTSPFHWDIGPTTTALSGNTLARGYNGAALARGGHYYWRVRGRDPDNALSVWSDTAEFNINELPVATKVSPLANGLAYIHNLGTDLSVWTLAGAHAKPRFQWSYADGDGQPQKQFEVKVWSADGLTLLYDSGPITSAATVYDAPWALVHDQVYQWSVEVYDGLEWSVLAKSTFKVKWAQAIYETPALPASSGWGFASTKAGAGQTAVLFATATAAAGVGRSAWASDIGSLTPNARLNVMVRLAHQTGTAPTLTNMTFTYSVGVGVMPDNWLFSPAPPAVGWSLGHDVVRFGSQAVKCVVSSTADQKAKPFRVVSTDHLPVKGATTYVFSVYVKTDDFRQQLTGSNKIVLEVYPAGSTDPIPANNLIGADGVIGSDYETQNTAGKGDRNWQRLHYVFTTDQDHTEVDVYVTYRNVGAAATGDVFHLDGAQLESGQVVTAWTPGQIAAAGAATTDALGVQIDAVQGGVLRLRGADGGDRDLVELGDRGLLLGGDTEVYSPAPNVVSLPFVGREWKKAAQQSINDSTWTKATGWTGVGRFDQGGITMVGSDIVLPYAGLWLVVCTAEFAVSAAGMRIVGVGTDTVSPSGLSDHQRTPGLATPGTLFRGTFPWFNPVAGNKIAVWVWQNAGTAQNMNVQSTVAVMFMGHLS